MLSVKQLRLMNETGGEFPIAFDAPQNDIEAAVDRAIAAANAELPRGTVYEVRGKTRPTGDLGDYGRHREGETSADQRGFFGGMKQEPCFRHKVALAEEFELGGYLRIARQKVP